MNLQHQSLPEQLREDRDALYYPYIHFRNDEWVKLTLLTFGRLRRIVPYRFKETRDSALVTELRRLNGSHCGYLIREEYLGSLAVKDAQTKMLEVLTQHEDYIRAQYSKENAKLDYGERFESFLMHRGKLEGLLDKLTEWKIAWNPQPINMNEYEPGEPEEWFAMHPKLGEAIMSNFAIAVARDQGLDIVTYKADLHHKIAASTDEGVFAKLLGENPRPQVASKEANINDLAEITLSMNFDFTKLTAKNIADLIHDGKDLKNFKDSLVKDAFSIPPIEDPIERHRRLKEAARGVMDRWLSYKQSLPQFALDCILDTTDVKLPDQIAALVGASSYTELGAGAGLAIGFLGYSGVKVFRKYQENQKSPLQYLTKIQNGGASMVVAPTSIQ
jgi:hypothetical protein